MASLSTKGIREEQLKRKLRSVEEHLLATLVDDVPASSTQEQQPAEGTEGAEMPSTSGIGAPQSVDDGCPTAIEGLEDEQEDESGCTDEAESVAGGELEENGVVELSDG